MVSNFFHTGPIIRFQRLFNKLNSKLFDDSSAVLVPHTVDILVFVFVFVVRVTGFFRHLLVPTRIGLQCGNDRPKSSRTRSPCLVRSGVLHLLATAGRPDGRNIGEEPEGDEEPTER